MRVLVADDDAVNRRLLETWLARWGYEVVSTEEGARALEILRGEAPPHVAVLDWMMPGLDGAEVCRRLREAQGRAYVYILLLTAKERREDTVEGLEAGADDYVTKPFDPPVLKARVRAGVRVVELERALGAKVRELESALEHVTRLQGLLPICMFCKRIRDERQVWTRLEEYISEHSEASFTHSLCRDCRDEHYPAKRA